MERGICRIQHFRKRNSLVHVCRCLIRKSEHEETGGFNTGLLGKVDALLDFGQINLLIRAAQDVGGPRFNPKMNQAASCLSHSIEKLPVYSVCSCLATPGKGQVSLNEFIAEPDDAIPFQGEFKIDEVSGPNPKSIDRFRHLIQ